LFVYKADVLLANSMEFSALPTLCPAVQLVIVTVT